MSLENRHLVWDCKQVACNRRDTYGYFTIHNQSGRELQIIGKEVEACRTKIEEDASWIVSVIYPSRQHHIFVVFKIEDGKMCLRFEVNPWDFESIAKKLKKELPFDLFQEVTAKRFKGINYL